MWHKTISIVCLDWSKSMAMQICSFETHQNIFCPMPWQLETQTSSTDKGIHILYSFKYILSIALLNDSTSQIMNKTLNQFHVIIWVWFLPIIRRLFPILYFSLNNSSKLERAVYISGYNKISIFFLLL